MYHLNFVIAFMFSYPFSLHYHYLNITFTHLQVRYLRGLARYLCCANETVFRQGVLAVLLLSCIYSNSIVSGHTILYVSIFIKLLLYYCTNLTRFLLRID